MHRFDRVLKLVLPILLVTLAACNLSMGEPLPTVTVQVLPTSTFRVPATIPPTNTFAPLPTQTTRPLPTNPPPPPAFNVRQPLPGPVCSVSPNVAAANIRS